MQEKNTWKVNGFLALVVLLLLLFSFLYNTIRLLVALELGQALLLGLLPVILICFLLSGVTIVQPNQAKALTFFGRYMGTVRDSGIWMTIPLTAKKKVSLRVRNFNCKTLKVNDINGNPVEIAAVVVFRVVDSARAVFDVDDYEKFVEVQSETALRHVATKYPYDNFEDDGMSLRGNAEEVADELARELQVRLDVAGVKVMEARLTHLAYATEIASAMLQRQQAAAIVSARAKIVEGAVGMAQMAIEQLQRDGIVELDEERKVAMINNLMVAIVSDRAAQPVLNTGSLY